MGSTPITDLYIGRKDKPEVVSKTHGRYRGNVVQAMTITRQQTTQVYDEYDNDNPVFSIREYDGSEASLEWLSSDVNYIEAMLMDVNPAVSPMLYDPAQIQPVDVILHRTGANAVKITRASLLCYGQVSANTTTPELKGAEKNSVTLKFLKEKQVGGAEIQYTRFVNTPTYPTADDAAFAGSVGTFPKATSLLTNSDGTTVRVLYAKKNGSPVNDTTQYTATASTFTVAVAPVSGDVWEVYSVTTV